MSKLRKRYSKEQKLEIVNQSLEEDVSLEELGKRYNIHPNSIYKWRRDLQVYENNAFPGNGNKLMSESDKEKEKLLQRIKELELEREILKKAVGIFSSPNKINLLS